jgi:hypothetical protein
VFCQVCSSTLKAGDLFCSGCGAIVPDHPPKPPATEAHDRIAGERKYLTVLCADLQHSTDLISGLDAEEAISRLEPALIGGSPQSRDCQQGRRRRIDRTVWRAACGRQSRRDGL